MSSDEDEKEITYTYEKVWSSTKINQNEFNGAPDEEGTASNPS